MDVTLISPFGNLDNVGIRSISSYLKSNKFDVNLVFMPSEGATDISKHMDFADYYSSKVLDQVAETCKKSKLIGITVMANYVPRVTKLTNDLRKRGVKALIIWGGMHPTLCPEDCVNVADAACVGEGEETFLELAKALRDNKGYENVPGLAFLKDNKFMKNSVGELPYDLDIYPDPDYRDMSKHYVLRNNSIVKFTKELYNEMMWVDHGYKKFMLFTTRGCPHRCTFCCNSSLVKIFEGKGRFIRKRSVERVIREMENIKKEFPFIQLFGLGDEVFFVRSLDELKEFSEKYKARINMPLQCEFSPMTVTEDKFKLMVDCGLVGVQMGVQSGSDKTNFDLYERYQTRETVRKAAEIIAKHDDKLKFYCYHFIIGNPLEGYQDKVDTIKFYFELPGEFLALLIPLIFYPGAKLTKEAMEKKLIDEDDFHYTQGWNVRQYRDLS